jgi:hypothetical protein
MVFPSIQFYYMMTPPLMEAACTSLKLSCPQIGLSGVWTSGRVRQPHGRPPLHPAVSFGGRPSDRRLEGGWPSGPLCQGPAARGRPLGAVRQGLSARGRQPGAALQGHPLSRNFGAP